jgi:hypothetical protein
MFDPAAMGTLRIGLDADQDATARRDRRRATAATARRKHVIRFALARGLRRAAAALERPNLGEVTG